jgi:antitoxin component of RelBE/YafQ-DinJ toxin-antitoxin module
MSATPEKMLSIRIPYEVGKRLKAVCALRGVTVRDVMTGFAQEVVDHAEELPAAAASNSVKFAALGAAVMRADRTPVRKKAR